MGGVIEFGRAIRSPHPQLIFKAKQADPDVFGRLVLPGRAGGLGAATCLGAWGQNEDGTYSGFIEGESDPQPYFYLFVPGGEYTVRNRDEMREVLAGMEQSKARAEEKRLRRQEELKNIPQRVADWREYVFREMKRNPDMMRRKA